MGHRLTDIYREALIFALKYVPDHVDVLPDLFLENGLIDQQDIEGVAKQNSPATKLTILFLEILPNKRKEVQQNVIKALSNRGLVDLAKFLKARLDWLDAQERNIRQNEGVFSPLLKYWRQKSLLSIADNIDQQPSAPPLAPPKLYQPGRYRPFPHPLAWILKEKADEADRERAELEANADQNYDQDEQELPATFGLALNETLKKIRDREQVMNQSCQAVNLPVFMDGDCIGGATEEGSQANDLLEVTLCQDYSKFPHGKYYPNNTNPKGLAVIFNNWKFDHPVYSKFPRDGTFIDCFTMAHLLMEFGYMVNVYHDLTAKGITTKMDKFANDPRHAECHSTVVVFLTHGDEGERIYGSDGVSVCKRELIKKLDGQNCSALIGKPKIFFIQACRGSMLNKVQTDDLGNEKPGEFSSFFILQSTPPGYFSFRSSHRGTFFIQALCRVLAKHAYSYHLYDLCIEVNDQLKKEDIFFELGCYRQVPDVSLANLDKRFYFMPSGRCVLEKTPESMPTGNQGSTAVGGKNEITAFYFGAWWSPYCRIFTADLKAFYEQIADPTLKVVLFSFDTNQLGYQQHIEATHKDWDIYHTIEVTQMFAKLCDIKCIPTLMVFNARGQVIAKNAYDDIQSARENPKDLFMKWTAM